MSLSRLVGALLSPPLVGRRPRSVRLDSLLTWTTNYLLTPSRKTV